MSKLSYRKTDIDTPEVNNYITMREIANSPIPISTIFKDALAEDKFELHSLNIMNKLKEKNANNHYKCLKKNYNKEKTKDKKKKKKVRFKMDFIDEVLIESFKEHNLKMCFMQEEMEEPLIIKKKNCKECIENFCLII
jgi:hypothetical protein